MFVKPAFSIDYPCYKGRDRRAARAGETQWRCVEKLKYDRPVCRLRVERNELAKTEGRPPPGHITDNTLVSENDLDLLLFAPSVGRLRNCFTAPHGIADRRHSMCHSHERETAEVHPVHMVGGLAPTPPSGDHKQGYGDDQHRSRPVNAVNPTGKVAVVTGGSGAVGSAICHRLAVDGHHVVIGFNARDPVAAKLASALRRAGCAVQALQVDITRAERVTELFETVLLDLQRVDFVVNSAGIARFRPLGELDVPTYEKSQLTVG